jgi:cell division septal protein FtsQ
MPSKPLDETVWQAWLAKNRTEDRRRTAVRMKIVKIITFLLLLALIFIWQIRSSSRIADLLLVSVALTGMIVAGSHGRRCQSD